LKTKITNKIYIFSASLYADSGLCVASCVEAYVCHLRIYVEGRLRK